MRTGNGGIDVFRWVQAAEPPNMDIPRNKNPRRPSHTSNCSVSVIFNVQLVPTFYLVIKHINLIDNNLRL
jgi:hypothetical protein